MNCRAESANRDLGITSCQRDSGRVFSSVIPYFKLSIRGSQRTTLRHLNIYPYFFQARE